jgi:hypothetical protein
MQRNRGSQFYANNFFLNSMIIGNKLLLDFLWLSDVNNQEHVINVLTESLHLGPVRCFNSKPQTIKMLSRRSSKVQLPAPRAARFINII